MRGLAIDVAAWSSPWRYRSPGDKAGLSIGLVVCALALPVWPGCLLVTVAAVGLTTGPAGVGWRVLARAARGAALFVVLGAAGIAITWRPGGGLAVTPASAADALRTSAHAVAGTSAMLLLATTTPLSDLLAWARRRGVPEVVVDIAGLVYRLLFVLLSTTQAIRAAQVARLGYASRAATMRSAAALTAAVLVRAWTRARRLEDGLAGRGLDGPLRVLADDRPSSTRFVAGSVVALVTIVATSLAVSSFGGTG